MKINFSIGRAFSVSFVTVIFSMFSGHATAQCLVDSHTLVNSCGPWIGAWTNNYPQVKNDFEDLMLYHEQRVGRQMGIVHDYLPAGKVALTSEDLYFINRANTYELVSWNPATIWANAAGGDSMVNGQIDEMAASIKAVSPKTIMLSLAHEPEQNVSTGTTCHMSGTGSAGSPADYVNMWHNVETRFANDGVTNVVWVMTYNGNSNYNPCMTNSLWPGNSYVQWVAWDPYDTGNQGYIASVSSFYNTLTSLTTSTYNYTGMPWMLGEFGVGGKLSQADAYQYYADMKTALDNNIFPNLDAYIVFDAQGSLYSQVEYGGDPNVVFDPTEQAAYNNFALDPALQGSPDSMQLIITATLSEVSGSGYQAVVTITNNGTETAQNVQLTSAVLGSAIGTPIPVSFSGNIAPGGGSAVTTIAFPSSAGPPGAPVAERYAGSYAGGTFGGSIRTILP